MQGENGYEALEYFRFTVTSGSATRGAELVGSESEATEATLERVEVQEQLHDEELDGFQHSELGAYKALMAIRCRCLSWEQD